MRNVCRDSVLTPPFFSKEYLGSIYLGAAQIGRQQQRAGAPLDDDNAFRHTFLILDGRKQPNSNIAVRHVLCGESDVDRAGSMHCLWQWLWKMIGQILRTRHLCKTRPPRRLTG